MLGVLFPTRPTGVAKAGWMLGEPCVTCRGVTYAPLPVDHGLSGWNIFQTCSTGRNKNEFTPTSSFPSISMAKQQIGRKSFAKKKINTVTIASWVKFHHTERDFFAAPIRILTDRFEWSSMTWTDHLLKFVPPHITPSSPFEGNRVPVRTNMGYSGECQAKWCGLQDGPLLKLYIEFFHPYKWPYKRVTGIISPL